MSTTTVPSPAPSPLPAAGGAAPAPLRIDIAGMTCASCVRRVEKAIAAVPGVTGAAVNLATEQAEVRFADRPDLPAVIAAVGKAGYEVHHETVEIAIDGMSCASCVGRVEKVLKALPGVLDAGVNLATGRATVDLVSGAVTLDDLERVIRKAGYDPRRLDTRAGEQADHDRQSRDAETALLRYQLTLAAVLTLPVFGTEMAGHLIPAVHHRLMALLGPWNWYGQFVLTTIVLFGPGARFFTKGIPALLRGAPDMNALVAIGAGAAWTYSGIATFLPGLLPAGTAQVYFEAAAVIVTLILFGRFLDARAKGRTGDAIRKLVGLQVRTARVQHPNVHGAAVITEIPIHEVRVGDIVVLRPGERVPVDGTVVDGSTLIDESMVTGESLPVTKGPGAAVVGGTVNKTGGITVRATKVGADTVLAQIIRMVQAAQGAKLPIQTQVDKITAWFVPAVMTAAALTFAGWLIWGPAPALAYALVNAVAVLIIACPCAMGLATPTSIMVGTGRAAGLGVLFRKGDALQTLRDATVIALDKTGTLTTGKPVLTDLILAPGAEEPDVLARVAAVEARSEHPVAAAIVQAARDRGLPLEAVTGFEALPGFGATGTVGDARVAVGADRFMTTLHIDITRFTADAARLGEEGKSPLYVALDGRLAAIIAVADPVKPTTAPALAALRALGLRIVMVTGDNRRTADAIARPLGITEVVAEVPPQGKADAIAALAADGARVAFVGDGINDAPALASASVGIAIGTGTDIAVESADVVLMSGDLRGVATAIALSVATIRNIRQNLFWAFAYNAALIPLAAGALYPLNGTLLSPMLAAGAMALSSVFVISNALRLRRFRGPFAAETPHGDDQEGAVP